MGAGQNDLFQSVSQLKVFYSSGFLIHFMVLNVFLIFRGPASGAHRRVLLPFKESLNSKIGVKFDKPISDGVDLGGLCDGGYGYFCSANELRLDPMGVQDLDKSVTSTLFEVVSGESRDTPFVLFVNDAEESIVWSLETYSTFRYWLEKLPDNVVVIGSQTHTDNRKERVILPTFKSCKWITRASLEQLISHILVVYFSQNLASTKPLFSVLIFRMRILWLAGSSNWSRMQQKP